jgi:predicted transcriptional regulator
MDWTKYGFVVSSSYRQKVVLSLKRYPKTPKQVSSELKLHLSHVSLTIKELCEIGIVENLTPELRKGKVYQLTTAGEEIAKALESFC